MKEKPVRSLSGIPMLLLGFAGLAVAVFLLLRGAIFLALPFVLVMPLLMLGFYMIEPTVPVMKTFFCEKFLHNKRFSMVKNNDKKVFYGIFYLACG